MVVKPGPKFSDGIRNACRGNYGVQRAIGAASHNAKPFGRSNIAARERFLSIRDDVAAECDDRRTSRNAIQVRRPKNRHGRLSVEVFRINNRAHSVDNNYLSDVGMRPRSFLGKTNLLLRRAST